MKSSPMLRLTRSRASLNGEIAETITPTPLRVSNSATKPILRMFVSLSSREKPRPLERLVRTMSPSRTSTLPNLCLSSFSTISLIVVLPAPESPVNHSVKPRPCLLPFSTTPSSCLFFRLLLKGAGQSDQSPSASRRPSMRTSTSSGCETLRMDRPSAQGLPPSLARPEHALGGVGQVPCHQRLSSGEPKARCSPTGDTSADRHKSTATYIEADTEQ